MNLKTTLILLVVLGFAVAALLVTQMERTDYTTPTPPNAERQPIGEPILGEERFGQSLSRIALSFAADGNNVDLEKYRGRWSVVRPHRFPADTQAVNELLGLLSGLRGTDEPYDGGQLRGAKTLTLGGDRGDITIALQQRLGVGRARLVVSDGSNTSAYNANDTLHDLFDAIDPRVFFARSIDAPLITELGRIEINIQGESPSAVFQHDDRWWIETPTTPQRALGLGLPDAQGVNDFIAWLDNVEVLEHRTYDKPSDLARFGLDQPQITVRYLPIGAVKDDAKAGWLLRVGAFDVVGQTRFVSFGRADDPLPAVFTMEALKAIAFGQSARTFRDPRIVSTPPTLTASLTIKQPGMADRKIDIKPDGGATVTDGTSPASEMSIKDCTAMLNALTRARAQAYAESRLDELNIIASVELVPRLDAEPETFTIGTFSFDGNQDQTLWVRRGDEPLALRVDLSAVKALLRPAILTPELP